METLIYLNQKLQDNSDKKGETQSSTLHMHKGLYGDGNRVHWIQPVSRTSLDHICLQSYTAQTQNFKWKEIRISVKMVSIQLKKPDMTTSKTSWEEYYFPPAL